MTSILLTRPAGDNESLASALHEAGLQTLIVPLSRIIPIAVPNLAELFQRHPPGGIILTSRHALRMLPTEAISINPNLPVLAVGNATAQEARTQGFTHVIEGGGDIASLKQALIAHPLPIHTNWWYLRGQHVREDLHNAFAGEISIVDIITYDAVLPEALPETFTSAWRHHQIRAIIFYSARHATWLTEHLPGPVPAQITAFAISPAIAQTLSESGWPSVIVAPHEKMASTVARTLKIE